VFLSDVLYEDSDNNRAAMKSEGDQEFSSTLGGLGSLDPLDDDFDDMINIEEDAAELKTGHTDQFFMVFEKEVKAIVKSGYSEQEE
jgi:hypothetical protein